MERKVIIGKKYKHFKGIEVEILNIGKDSNSLRDVVIYKHDDEVWVRDYDEFISKVDKNKYPNVNQEYRFELINND